MRCTKRYIIFLFSVLLAAHLPAQDLTGTWEGDMGGEQFLQLNIIQNGDRICGYTRDYVKADRRSYCKAYFQGRYDKKRDRFFLEGTSFVENSGGHVLMRISLTSHFIDGEIILEGYSNAKSILLSLLGGGSPADYVYLKKVSNRPQQMLEKMRDCFPEEKKKDTLVRAPIPKPADSIVKKKPEEKAKDTLVKVSIPVKPADTVAMIVPPVIKAKDSITVPKTVSKRKNTEQSHIEVNVKSITLNVYDNAVVDGDTISVFYNGKLLLSHQRLSEKPIVINLELDEKQARHELVLYAENLGSIPPNTALIVIYAGNKRYELFSSASLEENAVLVFDYRPK